MLRAVQVHIFGGWVCFCTCCNVVFFCLWAVMIPLFVCLVLSRGLSCTWFWGWFWKSQLHYL